MSKPPKKYGEAFGAMFRALSWDYSAHNSPTTQALGTLLKKCEESGFVPVIVRSAHHRCARSTSNITAVSVAKHPDVFIILDVLKSLDFIMGYYGAFRTWSYTYIHTKPNPNSNWASWPFPIPHVRRLVAWTTIFQTRFSSATMQISPARDT